MISLPDAEREPLTPPQRYALDVLVDLARLLPAAEPVRDVVRLDVIDEDAPVGLTGLGAGSTWHVSDGRVGVPLHALELITEVAGAGTEQRTTARDRHQRVPASANPLVIAGLERAPLISQAAVALRRAVVEAAGRRPVLLASPWPAGHRWAMALTHDVDVVNWWPAFTALRVAELARGGELARAGRVIVAALQRAFGDPVRAGVRGVLGAESAHGYPATWFFLTGTPTLGGMMEGDITYLAESERARWIVDAVREAGHEIGLHGSFSTCISAERFAAERDRLERLAQRPVSGVRQHYLRMSPGETQLAMRAAGFAYDATYGFSSRNGFRLGVADVVPGWYAPDESRSDLDEVPLIWMDRALSKYSGVEDPAAWAADAQQLISAAAAVEGLWVGLWHPNLTGPLGFPDAESAFAAIVARAASDAPWVATLESVVHWRRARRSLRVEELAPDGRVRVSRAGDAGYPLAIERADGTTVPAGTIEWRSRSP